MKQKAKKPWKPKKGEIVYVSDKSEQQAILNGLATEYCGMFQGFYAVLISMDKIPTLWRYAAPVPKKKVKK